MDIINAAHAQQGDQGQKLLAQGTNLSMRLWEESLTDGDKKSSRARSYETVGYVIKGQAELIIGSSSTLLRPGDSWVVPSEVEHSYRILEDFVAIEATHPPAR